MGDFVEAIPSPILQKTSAIADRHSCQRTPIITRPCCISLIDLEYWYYNEFLSATSIRRPEESVSGNFLKRSTYSENERDLHAVNLQKCYEEENKRIIDETRNINDNFEERWVKYGNLPLALAGHVYGLEFVRSSSLCLDHVIRFEAIAKIIFVIDTYDMIYNSGYIQLRQRDIVQALQKLSDILTNYDFNHFINNFNDIDFCSFCAEFDMLRIFAELLKYILSFSHRVLLRCPAIVQKLSAVSNSIIPFFDTDRWRLENSCHQRRIRTGCDNYILDHYMTHNKNAYAECLYKNHSLKLPPKLYFIYLTACRKFHGKTLTELRRDSPTEHCMICLHSLHTAHRLSVSLHCPHIFCGECFREWVTSDNANRK